jgi:hypothetical protein
MNWQAKLRMLVDAANQGHHLASESFYYTMPLAATQIDEYAGGLPFDLPQALRDLYMITDGVFLAGSYRICGLVSAEIEDTLATMNREWLPEYREIWKGMHIHFIVGSTSDGDFLCVTDHGSIVSIYKYDSGEVVTLADSLDSFFDEVCLGPGYLHYTSPHPDDEWLRILQEFGFVQGMSSAGGTTA